MSKAALWIVPFMFCVAISALAQSNRPTPSSCSFTTIQLGVYTSTSAINNKGAIVGTYNPTARGQAGYVLQGGNVTNIVWPEAAFTSAYGISDNGAVVGAYAITLSCPVEVSILGLD